MPLEVDRITLPSRSWRTPVAMAFLVSSIAFWKFHGFSEKISSVKAGLLNAILGRNSEYVHLAHLLPTLDRISYRTYSLGRRFDWTQLEISIPDRNSPCRPILDPLTRNLLDLSLYLGIRLRRSGYYIRSVRENATDFTDHSLTNSELIFSNSRFDHSNHLTYLCFALNNDLITDFRGHQNIYAVLVLAPSSEFFYVSTWKRASAKSKVISSKC